MSRLAKRTDGNHSLVVEQLREALPEANIFDSSGAGRGFPDLVIGWKGFNFLVELKNPARGRTRLTKAQVGFHENWQGPIFIAHSSLEVLAHIARFILNHYERRH